MPQKPLQEVQEIAKTLTVSTLLGALVNVEAPYEIIKAVEDLRNCSAADVAASVPAIFGYISAKIQADAIETYKNEKDKQDKKQPLLIEKYLN